MKHISLRILALMIVNLGIARDAVAQPVAGPAPPPMAPVPLPMVARPAAVVELLEDEGEALITHLNNLPTKERGNAMLESRDPFSGVSCLRVTPMQKFCHMVAGWNFPIVEHPELGQYRYICFAWKRTNGIQIMLQLLGDRTRTIHRYHAGLNGLGWKSIAISPSAPKQWALVTRDLYKDFGSFTLMGLAFTAPDGEAALYDHIYLARSLEDLEAVRPPSVGKRRPEAPTLAEMDQLWQDLAHHDAAVATPARWRLAVAPDATLAYLKRRDEAVKLPAEQQRQLKTWLVDLGSDDFKTREEAAQRLQKLTGAETVWLERQLKAGADPEVAARITAILKKEQADSNAWTPERIRELRVLRILEHIGTLPARELLTQASQGPASDRLVQEAKAALKRLAK